MTLTRLMKIVVRVEFVIVVRVGYTSTVLLPPPALNSPVSKNPPKEPTDHQHTTTTNYDNPNTLAVTSLAIPCMS